MSSNPSLSLKDGTIVGFNEARDDGVEVASAEPNAKHLHFSPGR